MAEYETRTQTLTRPIAEEICKRLASGESLSSICRDPDMPERYTVFRWQFNNEWFRDMMKTAREMQAEAFVDDTIEIADDASNDWMERETKRGTITVLNDEHVRRSDLRIRARQWAAERMAPTKFGDRKQVALSNPDGSAMETPRLIQVVGALPSPSGPVIEGEVIENEDDEPQQLEAGNGAE